MMFARDTQKLESLLGAKSDFRGEVKVKGTLRVDGLINGRLNADCIILSETAVVQGEINARRIIIGGKVEGNLRAQEILEIRSKGKVWGEVFTPKLSVTEGGEVNGKIEMKVSEKTKVLELDSQTKKA